MTPLVLTTEKIDYSKSTIAQLAQEIATPVIEGYISALQLDLQLKSLEETIKAARALLDAHVRVEAEQSIHEGVKDIHGVKIEVTKGYAKYSYDEDSEYKRIEGLLEDRKKLLSQVAKSSNLVMIDEATGEQIPKVSVASYTKDSIKYTFKK